MWVAMLKNLIEKYLLVALISYSCFGFSSVKTITIAAQKYDKFTQDNGKGIYWDTKKNIFNKEGYNIIFELFPLSRAQYLLQQKKVDIVVGAYHQEFEDAIYPNKIDSLDRDQIVLYLSSSNIGLSRLKSLDGAKVGWPRGYRYEKYLNVEFTHYEVSNAPQASHAPTEKTRILLDSGTRKWKLLLMKIISLGKITKRNH